MSRKWIILGLFCLLIAPAAAPAEEEEATACPPPEAAAASAPAAETAPADAPRAEAAPADATAVPAVWKGTNGMVVLAGGNSCLMECRQQCREDRDACYYFCGQHPQVFQQCIDQCDINFGECLSDCYNMCW